MSSLLKALQRKKYLVFTIAGVFFVILIIALSSSGNDTTDKIQKSRDLLDSVLEADEEIALGPDVAADDPRVIKRLRNVLMRKPSAGDYVLKDASSKYDPSMGQSGAILAALGSQTDGFFIECGALDGETRSNTLFMEKELGWKGILIEGDPSNFQLLLEKHRKVHSFPVCLSPYSYPTKVIFEQHFNIGKISKDTVAGSKKVEVECYPLYSILLAVGETNVDYFSLDVEGAEYKVLKAIPWDKVNIRALSVEFAHDPEGKSAITSFMDGVGYDMVQEVVAAGMLANDFIFVKR